MSITRRLIDLSEEYKQYDHYLTATRIQLDYIESLGFWYSAFGHQYVGRESHLKALAYRSIENSLYEKYHGEFRDLYRRTK